MVGACEIETCIDGTLLGFRPSVAKWASGTCSRIASTTSAFVVTHPDPILQVRWVSHPEITPLELDGRLRQSVS